MLKTIALKGRKTKKKLKGKSLVMTRAEFEAQQVDSRIELIQLLVPIGLMAFAEELNQEVERLAGPRYARFSGENKGYRHGTNPGTVKFLGQSVPMEVPRVRSNGKELPLTTYQQAHRGLVMNSELFRKVLYGISCRDYEAAATQIPGAIGLSKSTVSRQFVEASARQLRDFLDRDLSGDDFVAIFLDGKAFAEDMMVVALGITMGGDKKILGFVQTATENEAVLRPFLQSLLDRGFDISRGILAVTDGAKGLGSALKKVFGRQLHHQRCQWHKRENVVSYLPKTEQKAWKKRLQAAYERPSYDEAKRELLKIQAELEDLNQSAANSLAEGFEETLTLHRLGVFPVLGLSFKTTNCLESINSMAEQRCAKVDYWKNSSQKQRWLVAALTDIEPRLRRVKGWKHLGKLRAAMLYSLDEKQELEDVG